jgi:hypothetical protein
MLTLGFTGTRRGMTADQRISVLARARHFGSEICLRHGDCKGADAEMHRIGRDLDWYIIGHPPLHEKDRAWCVCNRTEAPLYYLDRNRAIVDACDELIATPAAMVEELRSGTWMTIRYAQRLRVPVTIIYPDGSFAFDP